MSEKTEIRATFIKMQPTLSLQLSAGQPGSYGVGSVTSSRCSTQDKAEPTPPFPKRPPARTLFYLISQEADVMGTPYSSIQLENSALDQTYSWESYLQSYDDIMCHKLNLIKDLKLVRDGKSLEYWLDVNA
jgi:hypothetical protein